MESQTQDEIQEQSLLAEIERLRQENEQLRQMNQDLSISLFTTAEHGDLIEAELHETNLRLKEEVKERMRAESTLHALVEMILREKDDLETIVQTIMEHGDVVDRQWENKLTEVTELANCDSLTHIANRRRFDEYLDQQWQQMSRSHLPLSAILCDVDHFKDYNDTYGHLQGDHCLQQIAQILSQQINRPADLLARYGGEEFAVVLPQTSLRGALQVAEKLRVAVRECQIPHCQSEIDSVITISVGAACVVPTLCGTPALLMDQADRALYLAKQHGKNQVMSLSVTP
ncbi:diguanylate cyclase [Egbenema bharatensis]|uniref:diguanylate cyclase n=1 Tax=Egbenema bharatensis TaxID=3463334 RepID=UPI003A865EA3